MKHVYGARPSTQPPATGGARIALPTPATSVDLREYCTYVDSQDGSQCVGEALTGALWVAGLNQGRRASALGVYRAARARERIRTSDPLPDTGCQPSDAFDAVVAAGVYPRDNEDTDPSQLTDVETVEDAVAAYHHRCDATWFTPIEPGDVDTAEAFLTAGWPVFFCMQVDSSYEALGNGGFNTWSGIKGPSLGGHAQVCVGFLANDSRVIWNSWGTGWADGGFSYIPRPIWADCATELVAVHGSPVL